MKKKILIVEDDEDIQELIDYNLTREGFQTKCVPSCEDAQLELKNELPDLMLLDLMLPGISGLDFCKSLRFEERYKHLPIIIVSAKSDEIDIVMGLELGADDYLTKPFSPKVLTARVKAVLRRKIDIKEVSEDAPIRFGDLEIHPGKHEVLVGGEDVSLSFSEFSILLYLAKHPGWVFTRSQIVTEIRGEGYPVTDRAIDTQIVGLRKKLGNSGKLIETIRGIGYRFKEAQ